MVERVFGDLVAPSEYRAASQNRSAIRFAEGDPERRTVDDANRDG